MPTWVEHLDMDVQDCVETIEQVMGDAANYDSDAEACDDIDDEWWEVFKTTLATSRDLMQTAQNALTKARAGQ